MDSNERHFEDIKVSKGTYHITQFADTGATMIHFMYGEKGHDLMAICDGSVHHEIIKKADGFFVYGEATMLRENLGELKGADLPEDVKKVLEIIK